jgi:hypothetical protein
MGKRGKNDLRPGSSLPGTGTAFSAERFYGFNRFRSNVKDGHVVTIFQYISADIPAHPAQSDESDIQRCSSAQGLRFLIEDMNVPKGCETSSKNGVPQPNPNASQSRGIGQTAEKQKKMGQISCHILCENIYLTKSNIELLKWQHL